MHENERVKSEDSLDTRNRSLSESIRSSRAEKRMGRLFKPPNATGNQSEVDQQQTQQQQHSPHSDSNTSERSFNTIAPQSMMVMGNQDRTVSDQGHSLMVDRSAIEKSITPSTPVSSNNRDHEQQQQQQQPAPLTLNQPKYKTRERVNTLSTLVEKKPLEKALSIEELLILSKKFKTFYDQFIRVTNVLHTNVDIKFKSHNVFLAVLETVEKNVSKPNTPSNEIAENISKHLSLSVVQCMNDLKSFIQNLKLGLTPLNKSKSSDVLRSAYFSIFSLFTEIVNIAKLVIPITKPLKKSTRKANKRQRKLKSESQSKSETVQIQPQLQQQHSQASSQTTSSSSQTQLSQNTSSLTTSSPHLSFKAPPRSRSRSSISIQRSQSIIQRQTPAPLPTQKPPHNQQYPQSKLKPSLSINRIPAPNPSNPSAQSVPMRQSSSRSFSSSMRQDSDLSMFNIAQDQLVGDERLVESINHTIQSAQVVFSQVNSAISKSAMSTAQSQSDAEGSSDEPLDTIATKVKELTNHCMNSMEKTRRMKIALHTFKQRPSNIKMDELQQTLYETTNMFLKSIISILAATKGAIEDLPALNEVRSSLSILTRATKELTIKLETSALKNSVVSNNPSNAVDQPPLSSIPSMSTFHGNGPLSAVIQSSSMSFDLSGNYPMSAGVVNNFPGGGIARRVSSRVVSNGGSVVNQPQTRIQRQDVLETKGSIDSMQQHIKTLQLQQQVNQKGDQPIQTPLSVTTPLIASIGTTAASAVLPISSPLKSINDPPPSQGGMSKSTSNSNINSGLKLHQQPPPQQRTPKQMETNPFDKILFK